MKSSSNSENAEQKPAPEGELITRPDGSQVIKVKQRKRRSKQTPKKSQQKQDPLVKWTVIILLIAVLAIPAIGAIVIVAKYNGKSFKELTESNITSVTSAKATKLNTLKVTPISFKAKASDIIWADQSFIKQASFKDISTDLLPTTFTSKKWIGQDLISKQGQIYLQNPASYTPSEEHKFTNSIYQFNALRCESLDLHFGSTDKSPAIKNLLAAIRKNAEDQIKIVFQQGTVELPNWPAINISSGIITHNSNNISINTLIQQASGAGIIKLNGLIEKSAHKTAALNIEISKFPLQELLGEGLNHIFEGVIDSPKGTFTYDLSKPSDEALRIEIPFESKSITMSQLPMFEAISAFSGDGAYKDPSSNHCTGTLILTKNDVSITDLNLISNRLITIQGSISSSIDGEMKGELQVGLPTSIVAEANQSAFSAPVDGFQTTPVTISGNIHNPHDNLKEKLVSQQKITPQTIKESTPLEEFEALTQ